MLSDLTGLSNDLPNALHKIWVEQVDTTTAWVNPPVLDYTVQPYPANSSARKQGAWQQLNDQLVKRQHSARKRGARHTVRVSEVGGRD